ncbi:right-handed parallel beta-helix repeat-containing protein [Spirosoma taeanense]|uniref:right-handed parallel beta-helix repeat-containing protein n=1 Tax=Spirosoma taeanense TaxID=2735870 RepID=UPI001F03E847|nr:right-handed parallel beta-helix repeat-containing protein [Spirosoma taeanense]
MKIGPGATVCIQAGNYDYLRLNNFVGTADNPIKFVNCGGLVDVNYPTGSTTGIAFQGCRYFRITGTGDSNYSYGIRISKTGQSISGLNITTLSTDCEVDHLEVSNTGFAGIMIKTDPTCDPATQRGNFTMYNVKVHHNYVHDTIGEGFYIGNSFWNNGHPRTCEGQSVRLPPHEIIGLEISYNRSENTGCEGIQYACAPNSRVHHNTVINAGIQPFDPNQDNGVQIGGGVSGWFYNNTIQKAAGVGLIIVGHLGPNYAYNNIITNTGENGIFVDERTGTLANVDIVLANNTVITTANEGIQLYNETQNNYIFNSVILNPADGKFISTLNKDVHYTAQNNFTSMNIGDARFVNATGGDYHLAAGSPLIDAGQNMSRYGVTTDLSDISRLLSSAYDVGAYEYVATSSTPLPVELLSFTAKPQGQQVQLAWATTSERDADRFEVQRSHDLSEFVTLGEVKAKGNTSQRQYYGLLDGRPLDGVNYYRLRQVDQDGKTAYSKIISAVIDELSPSLELLGNPIDGRLIQASVRNLPGANYHLSTLTGRELMVNSDLQPDGVLTLTPAQPLPAGVYLLWTNNSATRLVQKIVVY